MFLIGTIDPSGNFQADALSADPNLTTFATLGEAIQAVVEVIENADEIWDSSLENSAIQDDARNIVWRQS